MKSFLVTSLAVISFSAFAGTPSFNNLSKSDLQHVGNEFAANFAHTAVAAPETEGIWGVEVGIVGGKASSPGLKDTVNKAGGDGSDFENMFHAGLMARGHGPFDLFAEITLLPEREISDVDVSAKSLGLGWNAGSFFNWPLDVAIGLNVATSEVSFHQDSPVPADIDVEGKSRVFWVGVSKKFLFITPYLKVGTARTESEVKSTADIFGFSNSLSEETTTTGAYGALGFNVQLLFIRLGIEGATLNGVKSASGKFSFAF